jgi:hypothetical protein
MITFPEDFKKVAHPVIKGATRWLYKEISVIGGAGVYGDGINTFEMWDFRQDEPQPYLTKEEINLHLQNNPI